MKKTLVYMVFGILLISFAYAEIQNLGTFSKGECVMLKQLCASCTFNNITSVMSPAPNAVAIISRIPMEKIGSEYNYSFCNTSLIGTYTVNGVGDLDGTDTAWNYNFEITNTGRNPVNPTSLVIGIGVMALVLLFVSYKLENEHVILKLLMTITSITLIVLIPAQLITQSSEGILYKLIIYFFVSFWLYIAGYFVYFILRKMGIIVKGGDDEED